MKTIVILCICFVAALGAPANPPPALEFTDNRDERNGYSLKYVTVDGTIVSERGTVVPSTNGEGNIMTYEGKYQFIGDDGKLYVTKYRSDAEGRLVIEGDHLPKQVEPLPVPKVLVPVV